jgi:hypothetical protein
MRVRPGGVARGADVAQSRERYGGRRACGLGAGWVVYLGGDGEGRREALGGRELRRQAHEGSRRFARGKDTQGGGAQLCAGWASPHEASSAAAT